MSMQRSLLPALLPLALASVGAAQSTRPVAFTNARLVTVAGDPIERGTLVVRNGKIEAIGADAVVPAGARVVDASGMTIMPGLVSAWSHAGLSRPRPTRTEGPQRGRGRRRSEPTPT
jgi:imidazolonepropionase-like amidohydrolase